MGYSLPAYIQNKKDWNKEKLDQMIPTFQLTGLYPE